MNNIEGKLKMTDCILHVFCDMENIRFKALFINFL